MSLPAELGTPDTSVTHQIADVADRPGEPDAAGSLDGS
jgi:hypothetical protein